VVEHTVMMTATGRVCGDPPTATPLAMSDPGEGTGRQGPWADADEEHRADKQQGDAEALEVEGDPRGGLQSKEYRTADPRDIVTEGDVAMSGPAGAPQEGKSVEERRAESEAWRERGG
jgi:hypothetical protein